MAQKILNEKHLQVALDVLSAFNQCKNRILLIPEKERVFADQVSLNAYESVIEEFEMEIKAYEDSLIS